MWQLVFQAFFCTLIHFILMITLYDRYCHCCHVKHKEAKSRETKELPIVRQVARWRFKSEQIGFSRVCTCEWRSKRMKKMKEEPRIKTSHILKNAELKKQTSQIYHQKQEIAPKCYRVGKTGSQGRAKRLKATCKTQSWSLSGCFHWLPVTW